GEVDASNGLDNITRKAYKRRDASVKQVVKNLKLVEGFCEHDTDRATGVNQDTPNIEVGDVCPNDERVVMGKDDATLLLAEGNGGTSLFWASSTCAHARW
ncbi:unnamed protein product, partial [Prunus brigantina]